MFFDQLNLGLLFRPLHTRRSVLVPGNMTENTDAVVVDFFTPRSGCGVYVNNLPPSFDYEDAQHIFSTFGPLFTIKMEFGAGPSSRVPVWCVVCFYLAQSAQHAVASLHRKMRFKGQYLFLRLLRPAEVTFERRPLSVRKCFDLAQFYLGFHQVSQSVLVSMPDSSADTEACESWRTQVQLQLGDKSVGGMASAHVSESDTPLTSAADRIKFLRTRSCSKAIQQAFTSVSEVHTDISQMNLYRWRSERRLKPLGMSSSSSTLLLTVVE